MPKSSSEDHSDMGENKAFRSRWLLVIDNDFSNLILKRQRAPDLRRIVQENRNYFILNSEGRLKLEFQVDPSILH